MNYGDTPLNRNHTQNLLYHRPDCHKKTLFTIEASLRMDSATGSLEHPKQIWSMPLILMRSMNHTYWVVLGLVVLWVKWPSLVQPAETVFKVERQGKLIQWFRRRLLTPLQGLFLCFTFFVFMAMPAACESFRARAQTHVTVVTQATAGAMPGP